MKRGIPTRKQKRGQVTIFIIIALLILSAIIILYIYIKPTGNIQPTQGPRFEGCVKDTVEQTLETLSPQAGYSKPEFTYMHQGAYYTYLCYTNEYYQTCTIQQPFLKPFYEQELEKSMRQTIDACYNSALDELKAQGYGVTEGTLTYDVHLEPSQIRVEINAPTITGTQSTKKINVQLSNPLYETLMIATSILQTEAQLGDSDTRAYQIYYPDYTIDKWKQSDGTTLYSIKNNLFNTPYRFASRSLAWPPGYQP